MIVEIHVERRMLMTNQYKKERKKNQHVINHNCNEKKSIFVVHNNIYSPFSSALFCLILSSRFLAVVPYMSFYRIFYRYTLRCVFVFVCVCVCVHVVRTKQQQQKQQKRNKNEQMAEVNVNVRGR